MIPFWLIVHVLMHAHANNTTYYVLTKLHVIEILL